MLKTLALLKPFVTEELGRCSLNDLALQYQAQPDPRILATAYNKIYKLATVVKNQYWGLNEDDVASFCLEELDKCLRSYNGSSQFTTYFCTVFRNKLRTETESLNYKKRKCILESINDLINIGVEDTYNLIELLLPNTLTDKEYKLCMLESEGYSSRECAEIIGCSVMTISNMKKSLRIKLDGLQN